MLKKRLIGVITVRNGWAVQSFGYGRYLPLGKPEVLAENLDRWGADEILLQCVDRSGGAVGPDFELLERVAKKGLGTPLIYCGGIRSVEDGCRAVSLGADRIVIDALLHDDLAIVEALSRRLGSQAIIAAMPLAVGEHGLEWLDHRSRECRPVPDDVLEFLENKVVSEVLVIDWRHEGHRRGFEIGLVDSFPAKGTALILFGGISETDQLRQLLEIPRVAAVAVGNFLNYREHAVAAYRQKAVGLPLRTVAVNGLSGELSSRQG